MAEHNTLVLEMCRLTYGMLSSMDVMIELANSTLDLHRLDMYKKESC